MHHEDAPGSLAAVRAGEHAQAAAAALAAAANEAAKAPEARAAV